MTVLIAGAGIGGLALALTCEQIGVPFKVFESARELRPLGVGINLQPNAVRELYELGLEDNLPEIGVMTREFCLFTKRGLEIWTEPRGTWAGYKWPQFSVHRGELQMLLYRTLVERAGPDCVEPGWKAVGFESTDDGALLHLESHAGEKRQETGTLIVGADGIHSSVRAQMNPKEGPPIWGGAVLWRGTSPGIPYRTGASMVMIGHATQRIVSYPISSPEPETGLATINWIAELTYDPSNGWNKEDWNREADKSDFQPQFMDWTYDWFDFPALVERAGKVFEYPMVDRDPLNNWTEGRVTLLGDAAHATYPVGSNGASQAIIDARKMGRAFLDHGVTPTALKAYEDEMRPLTTKIIETNRAGGGPDAVLQLVEDRCDGQFDSLEDVVSREELASHADKYKAIAGFAVEALNERERIVPVGARET